MRSYLCGILLIACLPLLAGCTTLDLNLANFRGESADQTAQVAEVVCLWEAAEGVGLDGSPSRGFAGQILFFTRGSPEPVRINGDVRIYVFDDHGSAEEQTRPLHEFEFPAPAWNAFLQNTNLGQAYQLFIPYTRKGSNLASCALRVRMTAEGRSPVYSKLASVTLPGRRVKAKTAPQDSLLTAAAIPAVDPQPSIAEMAAIQKTSAELRTGNRTVRMDRLKSAARNAVRTADYNAELADKDLQPTFADESAEPPISRRYRMSSSGNDE